jgi:hypothetical protein
MQATGRVLRPSPGKPHAILIDLVDAYGSHGSPTDDREYSLTNEAHNCAPARERGFRSCPSCGYPFGYGVPVCPRCSWKVPVLAPPPIKIWDIELRRVFDGKNTPNDAKVRELERLVDVCARKGFALGFAVTEYRKLFGEAPDLRGQPEALKRSEYQRLVAIGRKNNYAPGFAAARYKALFSCWPPRAWASGAA